MPNEKGKVFWGQEKAVESAEYGEGLTAEKDEYVYVQLSSLKLFSFILVVLVWFLNVLFFN
jgi:hypothetical protein